MASGYNPHVMPRGGGFLPPASGQSGDSRPLRINPGAQPADRQDGRYMNYGETPRPGERPVTPLWEEIPGYGGGGGGGGGRFSGGIGGGGGGGSGGNVRATNRSVQAPETVRSQLSALLAENGDYIQQARRVASEAASARGMMSSGMAAGAAHSAAIQAGLPIAQQDASWYGQTAADNMEATNRAAIESANNATARATTRMSVNGQLMGAEMRNALEREQAALGRNFQRESNIWDSEELDRQDSRREGIDARSDFRRGEIDARSDYRRAGIDADSDYRRSAIDINEGRERFRLDMSAEYIQRRNEARDFAYRSILQENIQNPEEWDEYQTSGMFEFFSDQADGMFEETYADVFGP